MATRQLHTVHSNIPGCLPTVPVKPRRRKKIRLEDQAVNYCGEHSLVCWFLSFIGVPVGLLLSIGSICAVIGSLIWSAVSLF